MGHILAKLLNRAEPKNIDSFPNEVLRTILANLEVQQLIASRAVCRRWLSVTEDICRAKRSLLIVRKGALEDISRLTERFHGLVDWNKNCAILKLQPNRRYEISLFDDLLQVLVKLFPRVENLLFDDYLERTSGTAQNVFSLLDLWSSTIVSLRLPDFYRFPESHHVALSDHLDRLTAIKRLDFDGADFVKQTTLARLEHHSFVIYHVDKVVPHLGTRCTSLNLSGNVVCHWEMTQWHKLNTPLLKGLTHLSLYTDAEALSFICANCAALQMLNIRLNFQTFNADMIALLTRLSNLSELSIKFITINQVPALAQSNLAPLNSVRKFSLSLFKVETDHGQPFDGDLFCRVLSTMYPNLRHLIIQHKDLFVRDGIVPHLNRFVHLRKHDIVPY